MKYLYAICSWGLGHATRSLPIINALIQKGHEVTIAASDRSLQFLQQELPNCEFINFPDYPKPYTTTHFFRAKFAVYLPAIINSINNEKKRVDKLVENKKFDRIISDHRYGFFHKNIPSYFFGHQLRFIMPSRSKLLEKIGEKFNANYQKKFEYFIIPDYEKKNLAGDLCHNLNLFEKEKLKYVGIICMAEKQKKREKIDYFISLSGVEGQRKSFENLIMPQIKKLEGKIVVSLGKPEEKGITSKDNITIYQHLSSEEQISIMAESKLIIARSGYTTMMEVASLGKNALYIPYKGQTEQEYLAEHHEKLGNYYSVSQRELNLERDIGLTSSFKSFRRDCDIKKNIKNVLKIVT